MENFKRLLSGILVSSGFLLVDCDVIFAKGKGEAIVQQQQSDRRAPKVISKRKSQKDEASVVSNNLSDTSVLKTNKVERLKRRKTTKEAVLPAEEVNKDKLSNSKSIPLKNNRKKGFSYAFNVSDFDSLPNLGNALNRLYNKLNDESNSGSNDSRNLDGSAAVNDRKSGSDVGFEEDDVDDFGFSSTLGSLKDLNKDNAGEYERRERDVDGGKYVYESYVSKDGKTRTERRFFCKSSSGKV